MSYFEFFPSELVCFSRNPVRLNILCFPIIFRFLPPPEQNSIISILLYRLFLFSVFRIRLNVCFCLFYSLSYFFCSLFIFYYVNVFSYFLVLYDLFLSNPTCFYFHFFLSNMHLYRADLRCGIPADSPLFQAFQRFRRRMPVPVVFAAGNDGEKGYSNECPIIYREGSVYSPASAKNVLSVGSVYNSPSYNDIRASFSCMGPTSDGRIKPDILAPGVNIDSAGSSGEQEETCRLAVKSGTSMSTPIVAATASLFSQYLQEGFYPTGEAVPENGFIPTAATLKAMVIHSGQSIRGEGNPLFPKTISTPLPDNHQGFGRMDVKR